MILRFLGKVLTAVMKVFDVVIVQPTHHFFQDMSSLRAIWCWVILGLFCWTCVYIAKNNAAAHGTLLTVLGGVTTLVFTNYVFSTVWERTKNPQHIEAKPDPDEDGGSD